MKRALIRTFLAAGVALSAAPAHGQGWRSQNKQEHAQEINLRIGENATVSARGVKNYSEGAPGIAAVKLTTDGTKFVISGRKPGTTSLLLIDKNGKQTTYVINVFTRSPDAVQREVEALLENSPGMRVRRVGSRLFIEGGVRNEAEAKRVERIASLYPDQVESLVVIGQGAADRKINIRVDFYFVQYDRSSGYAVGVGWPGRIGGAGIASFGGAHDFLLGGTTSAQAVVVNQPLPGLDLAANKGWAKVMKHSTVVAVNGTEATFSSGGEQNFEVANGLTGTIKAIKFGTDVTVLPRLDPDTGELEIELKALISDLVPPVVTNTALPGRNESKLETLVRMKLGQSLVLSGISVRSQRHGVGGIPLLSDIPILGLLFGSHHDQETEVEGAIFVVPTAIEAVPKPASEMIDQALKQFDAYDGDIATASPLGEEPAAWKKRH